MDKPHIWQSAVSPSVLRVAGMSVENPNPATFVLISLFYLHINLMSTFLLHLSALLTSAFVNGKASEDSGVAELTVAQWTRRRPKIASP